MEILGLSVERLCLAREKHWDALSQNWRECSNDLQRIRKAIRDELLPEENGCLP